ncbi:zf-C3HC4_3 domain-containing protein [Cephalotus follicularis]|uniref:Zf-C3HC4_3 domain-containing protein n=1 Tax=Cephalotus follicularis TaxID=3775 RepID=A0A1Q3BFH9_CEPFO|nr:zf-C3HC4_3 domain-containing protein [Cephalotus follicularis]
MEEALESNPDVHIPSSSTSQVQEEEEEEEDEIVRQENEGSFHLTDHHLEMPQRQPSIVSYRVNISISDVAPSVIRDDVWSCLIVLVTFWFFAASMTLILGFYGSVNVQLAPNCSWLIQTNPLLVQSIKVEEIDELKSAGPTLYGFYKRPPLDVEINWTDTHDAFVPVNFHKEWIYFLNKGSKMEISYTVKSPSSLPLSLVIAKGRESLVEWVEDPSYPNTTLSWNIIYGTGKIQQEILEHSNYYIAVGNLNSEEVEVELKLSVKAFIYNTTKAYYRCSLGDHLCTLKLFILGTNVAVLSTPGAQEGIINDDWHVKLSYGPRWITYFAGSGVVTALILLAFRFCNVFRSTGRDGAGLEAERAPLLARKDDDLSSWGSSYESVSHDEDDLEEWLAVNTPEKENNSNPQRLCVICFAAPGDCFFLPCAHYAACFACATRIAEEAGSCPVCHRKMKKVRKIFTV